MNTRAAPAPEAARRRVGMWPMRRRLLFLHDALAVAGAMLALVLGAWLLLAAALLSLSGTLAYRVIDAFRSADVADLRAASPLLTPDERARALACLGVRDAAEPVRDPGLEDLRRYLRDLPGGVRLG